MTSSPPGGAFSAAGLTQCAPELTPTSAPAPGTVTQAQQDCCYTDWAGCNSTLRNIEGKWRSVNYIAYEDLGKINGKCKVYRR